MENGDILVTEISEAWISRITREGKVLWSVKAVSYTHLRAHETVLDLVCRLLLETKNNSLIWTLCHLNIS